MFWHGRDFTRLEVLSCLSWMSLGHHVALHCYDTIHNVPRGVTRHDAGDTLPRATLFVHKERGSIAPFANLFRYSILADHDVIWSDTDIIALREPPQKRYLFGWQDHDLINNAVLAYPNHSPLAEALLDIALHPHRLRRGDTPRRALQKLRRTAQGADPGNIFWGETGPTALTTQLRRLGLQDHACDVTTFYPVHYNQWERIFLPITEDPCYLINSSSTLHLWQEKLRRLSIDTNAQFPTDSLFERLWRRITQ